MAAVPAVTEDAPSEVFWMVSPTGAELPAVVFELDDLLPLRQAVRRPQGGMQPPRRSGSWCCSLVGVLDVRGHLETCDVVL